MYGLHRRPQWRWSLSLLSVVCAWLLVSTPPAALGFFMGDTKAVLNGCNDRWTLQDTVSMPLLYHMTVCVDVRVVIPGPWVAFSYSSVHALKPELGLEGDSQALYAWLLRVRHRFPVSLSPFQWHRVCLKRDVHGNTFSLQVDQALVAKRTVIAQAIPPSGSLWLGCRPRDKVRGAVLGKVEVYMFRMWPDLKDHGLCEDGSVIRWNAHYWGLTSPRAREMDPQLMCDHRRLKRDVRAKRSAAAIPTGFRRLFSPPPMPHTTTIAGPVMRTSAAAVTASSRTISSGSATSLSASARTSRTTNTGQHLESLATPSRTTSPASTPSRALISPTPASTASSSDVSRYSSASQTVAMATHDSHSVTTLSAMLTTPADSRTSAAPLSSCDFSQLCSGENAYFWMWLNVSAQEDGTTERQVHDMVSGAFRCDEVPSAASELCARNIQPEVSEVNCNHAANISRTHCGVLLELSRVVATCELQRVAASVLQRAGSDGLRATIVGEVERVGRSQCEGAASSSGRFVRCTSSSTLEEVCRANQYSSLSCSLFDPNSVAESTADAESCSGEAPQLCDCAAFCNSTNQFYATRLEVTSAAVTADLLRTLLSTRPCDTASECQSYLHIYQVYKDVHLECHGTEDRLYSCMVIMETSGVVDGCLFSELVQRLVDSQENITTELPLTRLVVCGSLESTVADLLASNLTWSASDQLISDVCPPEPTLFHCSANQSLAVLLSQSCPSTPVTPTTMTPSTTTEPATTSASQTADYKTPGPTNTPEFPAYTTDVTISSNTTDSAVSAPKTSTSSVNKTTVSNSGMTETFTLTQNDTTTNPTTEDAMWSTLDILDNTSTEMNPTSSATSASTTNPATFATSFPAIMSTLSVTTEDAATTAVFATVTAPYTTSVPPESTTFATSTAATTSATTAESTFASATATAIATPSTTIGFETQYTMASETTDSYGDATDNATSDTSMMITNPTDSTQTTVSGTETQTFFTSLDNTTEHASSSESVSTTANNVAHQTITLTPNNTTYNATSFATVTANRSSTTLTYSTTSSLAADTTLFNTTAATNQTAVGNTTIANDSRSLLNGTSSNVTTTSPTTTHTPGFDWTAAVEATASAGPSLNTTTVATAGPNMETQQNATGFFKNSTTTTQSSETVNMTAGTTDALPTNQTATDSTAGVGGNTNVTTNMTSNMRTTSTSAPDLTVSTTRSTRNTTAKGNLADNSTAASQTTADGVGPSVHATTAINSRSTAGSRINATTVSVTQNQASAEQQIDELLSQTQDASRLNSSQVDLVVSQLEKILEAESISKESAQKAINVVSNLMQADASALAPSANRIVKVVEQVGLKLSVEGRSEIISSELLVQLVQLVDGTNFQATSVDIISTDNVQTTALSRSLSRTSDPPAGSVFLPSSLTDGLSPEQQLQASRVQFTFYTKPVLFQDQTLNNQTVVSPVLATSVSNLSISNLKENIRFTIRHTDPQHTNFEASCVFWDFSLHGGSGGWSSDGCSVLNSSAEETVCGCSHLTSFAILLDLSRGEITDRQQAEILTFITYIGCGISAIFLAVTLLTYLSFEKLLRDIPAKILVQLCTALFFLNMVYLLDGWLALYTAPGLCISTGFFLHYFLLSAFTWTGLEALHMYLSIVQVFTPYLSRYMLKFSLMGWGFPLIVVVIIIAVDKDNYGLVTYGRFNDGTTNDFCWLRNDIAFYVGVVAYFLLIFVVCVIVFIVVMVQLSRIKRQNPQNQSPNRGLMADVRSIAGLVVLLGLTWGFALFAWGPLYLPFVYLFSIFNSLQGFFIFIFHCAYKENVRRQWRTYLCCGRLRLAENSDWSRTATQNTRHLSTGTATTSLHHLTSRSSSVASDSTNSSGSVFVDSGISDTSHSDVVLNEIHRRNLTHQFQV